MLKQNAIRAGLIVACTATSVLSTGCRSFPGAGMFARRGPSAEALAGSGPTTTYPVPPSHTANPEAIASIAGGTAVPNAPSAAESATAQVAGIEISPGFALPAGSDPAGVNMAAAQANGAFSPEDAGAAPPPSFVSNPVPTSAGSEGVNGSGGSLGLPNDFGDVPSFGNTSTAMANQPSGMGAPGTVPTGLGSPSSGPSGYAFGSKALTPKTPESPEPSFASTASSEATPSFAMPTSSIAPPSTEIDSLPQVAYEQPPAGGGFTLPGNVAQSPSSPPDMPSSPSIPGGMPSMAIEGPSMPMGVASMPTDAPAMAELTPPATPSVELSPTSVDPVLPPEVTAPSYTPSFSTARVPGSSSSSGYGPGSTGTSGGYPTSDSAPTTSGSFYR
ncbi:MAG: hypothetical protein AAGI63_10075 [Planctomycetota bacterium]